MLSDWLSAGLHVPTAVKRGLYTVNQCLVAVTIGQLTNCDAQQLEIALRGWLGLY